MRTFTIGGIHPPECKLTAGKSIVDMPLPKQAVVLLGQHIGAPTQAVVEKGAMVKTGQLLAKAGGFVSANIHSPVSGKVNKIAEVVDASGYPRPAIFIDVEGDEWMEGIDRSEDLISECDLEPAAIVQKINEAGIVGMGGACFPAHVKLTPPPGKKAEILVVNGVECEPYLTADHRLMLEKAPEIIVGIRILMKALNVDKAVIGIECNKSDAIELLQHIAKPYPAIEVMPLQMHYPQGGEKQLIEATTGRQVPSGCLPIEVGAVVQNVGTIFAIYEAVQKNKPLFERIVTVTGKSLSNAGNFRVRMGTPIKELLDFAGGLPENAGKVISGGPMMGKALASLDAPVAKGTSGVLVMDEADSKRGQASDCIRCAKCVAACPMGLEPYLLGALSEHKDWEGAEKQHMMDCIECGCCTFTCPANRPLLDYLRIGKAKVGALIRSRKQ